MSNDSTALVVADNERATQAEAKQRAEAAAEVKRQQNDNNRRAKMGEAYFDIRAIIERVSCDGGNVSKQSEMIVRAIASNNVANVRMEW